MGKKISDMDIDEKRDLEGELEAQASNLGLEAWESEGTSTSSLLEDQIGICHNCKYLRYCKSEYDLVLATCSEFRIRLTGTNRMKECNLHAPKGVLSLNEMYNMAYLIEPKGHKAGFLK